MHHVTEDVQALQLLICTCASLSQRALGDEAANQVSINFFGDGTANNGALSTPLLGGARPVLNP
jgi:hypothetical protein